MPEGLLVRTPPDEVEAACREPHVREFDRFGNRPMRGFVLVEPPGLTTDADLARWVDAGATHAKSRPPK